MTVQDSSSAILFTLTHSLRLHGEIQVPLSCCSERQLDVNVEQPFDVIQFSDSLKKSVRSNKSMKMVTYVSRPIPSAAMAYYSVCDPKGVNRFS